MSKEKKHDQYSKYIDIFFGGGGGVTSYTRIESELFVIPIPLRGQDNKVNKLFTNFDIVPHCLFYAYSLFGSICLWSFHAWEFYSNIDLYPVHVCNSKL